MSKHVVNSTLNSVYVLTDEDMIFHQAALRFCNPMLNEMERAEYLGEMMRAYRVLDSGRNA